jgi:peptidoglycan hydrolase CwlO-like protein
MDDAKKLAAMIPEEFSNAWYRQRLNAVEVLTGQLLATLVDELAKATHQVNTFRKEVNEIRQDREKDAAKIGELQGMIEEQNETIEKARAYVQKREKAAEVAA